MSKPHAEPPGTSSKPTVDPAQFLAHFKDLAHDLDDPDPWLAMFLDQSLPMDEGAKAALLLDLKSFSRQFLLPVVRPFARLLIIVIQILKIFLPRRFTSSKLLHKAIRWGLEWWVSPQANYLILRHFHIGSEIVGFIASNVDMKFEGLKPLRPRALKDVEDEIFLKHDLNLYNFVISLNRQLRERGTSLRAPPKLNFAAISDAPFSIEAFPNRWTNFLDLASAIELYTPMYQLLLTDHDFWRASNSLQLDETVGVYVAMLLGDATHLSLLNNKHPLVPLSTMRAGFRLLLHGLSAESLHGLLVLHKKHAIAGDQAAPGMRAFWHLQAG